MPKAMYDIIESSPRTSWLTLEQDSWVVNGLCEVLGRRSRDRVLARLDPGFDRQAVTPRVRLGNAPAVRP